MPRPKIVVNAFTAKEVQKITGLSVHMIDYLAREGYLSPTYDQGRVRGRVRFYSYRDLIVAKVVQRLRESGLELRRLKDSIRLLSEDETWFPKDGRQFDLLATDGKKLYYHDQKGGLVELTATRQRSFAFVLDVAVTQQEIKAKIAAKKLKSYTIRNEPLIYAKSGVRRR